MGSLHSVSCAAFVFLVACAPTADFDQYQQTITKFQTATDATSAVVSEHILTIRDVDRERLFTQLEETKNPCDLHWVKTRLPPNPASDQCVTKAIEVVREGRFSTDAIAARAEVFKVLNEYTALLSAVASSDLPSRWQAAAAGLGESVGSLIGTINSESDKQSLGRLQSMVGQNGPLTRIFAAMGEDLWLNPKRTEALDATVKRVKPQIDRISRLLREDFEFVRRRDTSEDNFDLFTATAEFGEAVDSALANDEDNAKEAQRRGKLAALRRVIEIDETQAEELTSIDATMDAFDDAHDALLAYAQSSKDRRDLATFVYFVDRYAGLAKELLEKFEEKKK